MRGATWIAAGLFLMFLGLCFQLVTVASEHYRDVLLAAAILVLTADLCFLRAFRAGGPVVRWVSVLLALPTLFVIADSLHRAPYVSW